MQTIKIITTSLFTFFICHQITQAQTITGRITDTNHQPVEFATIILLTTDSTYVNAAMSDTSGLFSLNNKLSK